MKFVAGVMVMSEEEERALLEDLKKKEKEYLKTLGVLTEEEEKGEEQVDAPHNETPNPEEFQQEGEAHEEDEERARGRRGRKPRG